MISPVGTFIESTPIIRVADGIWSVSLRIVGERKEPMFQYICVDSIIGVASSNASDVILAVSLPLDVEVQSDRVYVT